MDQQIWEILSHTQDQTNQHVELASYHLEDDAHIWFDMLEGQQELSSWRKLKDAMNLQFGTTEYEEFYGQGSSRTERWWITSTIRLRTRSGYMTDRQKINSFTCGLKLQLGMEMKSQKPISLIEAQGLAGNFEPKATLKSKMRYIQKIDRGTGRDHIS